MNKPVTFVRCYESHPVLKIGMATVYGGNCNYPAEGCDIYVGLSSSMAHMNMTYPWVQGTAILFPIQDMCAPEDAEQFKAMIDWLAYECTTKPVKLHVGCFGGHGRTSIVLAALITVITGNKDSVTWLREHYCKKAIESKVQVEFLHKYYGITKVKGTKEGKHYILEDAPIHHTYDTSMAGIGLIGMTDFKTTAVDFNRKFVKGRPDRAVEITPIPGKGNIWIA